jgi:hypothetical protein
MKRQQRKLKETWRPLSDQVIGRVTRWVYE